MKTKFMQAALDASIQALPDCLPNPPVGCVIVSNNQIIATGHTGKPGQRHAEADALAKLTGDLDDCEMYVTLEPCSFHGRTPSCAQEIVKRAVKKVFVGILDSDPRNQGAGIEILRRAGIEVETGMLAQPITAWLYPYLIKD